MSAQSQNNENINTIATRNRKSINLPLTKKMILAISGTIMLFGLIGSITTFIFAKNNLIRREIDNLTETTLEIERELELLFMPSEQIAKEIAETDIVLQALGSKNNGVQSNELSKFLEQFNLGEAYSSIYVMDKEGNTIAATDPEFIGKNYSFRDYFLDAKAEGKSHNSAVGITSKKLGYYFANAVYDKNNSFIGVVVVKYKPEVFNKEFCKNKCNQETKKIYLTDQNGFVLYSNSPENIFKLIGKPTETQVGNINALIDYNEENLSYLKYNNVQKDLGLDNKKIRTYEFYDTDNKTYSTIINIKASNYNYHIVVEESHEGYYQDALELSYVIAAFVAGTALVANLVLALIVKKIIDPLEKLNKAVINISKGEFDQSIEINTGDELEELAKNFKKMAQRLKEEKNQTEEKIKERTHELNQLNNAMVGRELKMVELKKEIEKLKKEIHA